MTMHLARGLTTTSTKKRVEKITKAKQEELERGWRDRNQRLKEIHLPKETFEQYIEWVYGRGKKDTSKKQHISPHPKTITTPICVASTSYNKNSGIRAISKAENKLDPCGVQSLKSFTPGPCSSKPAPTYTGEKILGIAVLHKSCLQPVFSQEEATEVARMRR